MPPPLTKPCRKDVEEILDDLSRSYVAHEDLRPVNLVRAPAGTTRCSQHQCVHQWNIIDFSWTKVDEYDNDPVKWKCLVLFQRAGYRNLYFYQGTWDM